MSLYDFDIPELRKNRSWVATENSTTATLVAGFRAVTLAGGTATAVPFSAGSRTGRLHRIQYLTAATAGSIVTLRCAQQDFTLADSFTAAWRFKISDPADVTGARMFLGARMTVTAMTNVDPGTLTNVVGIGHNSGETTLRVYGADGTAGTPVDLGANFSALGSFAGFYDFQVVGLGADGAFWRAVAWDDAVSPGPLAMASGIFARSPSETTGLTALNAFRTNNAAAQAVALDLAAVHNSSL